MIQSLHLRVDQIEASLGQEQTGNIVNPYNAVCVYRLHNLIY